MQPSTPAPATIFTGAPASYSVRKFEYGITDMSTWPAPNSVAMSALVGVTTKSRFTPSALASSRFFTRKNARLHRPEPCVALMVVAACAAPATSELAKPTGSARLTPAALAPLRKLRRELPAVRVEVRWL